MSDVSPPERVELPRIINGRYELIREIGRGGMGTVHAARCLLSGAQVAIKLVRVGHGDDRSRVKRFEREARILRTLRHPNTVRLLDHGVDAAGRAFLVMEYVNGNTLAALLRMRGAFGESRAITIALEVCASLREAHSCGIVHRDIKPANIIMSDGESGPQRIKLLDFGIGKEFARTSDDGATRPGCFVGSHRHAAPEQLLGGAADARSDVYSVGILLYELMTGTVPSDKRQVLIARPALQDPDALQRQYGMSTSMIAVLRKCLEWLPVNRFQSAAELSAALQACRASNVDPPTLPVEQAFPLLARRVSLPDRSLAINEPTAPARDRDAEMAAVPPYDAWKTTITLGVGAGLGGLALLTALSWIGG